jgi:transposase
LIQRLFKVSYTVTGVWKLLRRHGWSSQVPVRRASERDDGAIEAWKKEVWPQVTAAAAERGAWLCFEDEAGQGLRPPKGRTWGRAGVTPVVRVPGRGSGRVSVAGLVCYRPGYRSRLVYRVHVYRGRKGERKSFDWSQYRDLVVAAHNQLDAPIVLVWDNLNVHKMPEMKEFIDEHADWLTVFHLPAYAPELNPTEGVWSQMKGSLVNFAATSLDHLTQAIKHRLKRIQYRPNLIDGCLTETGLIIKQT